MNALKLLIGTPSRLDQSRIERSLARCLETCVMGTAHDLEGTIRLCAQHEPDMLLIAQDFVLHKDFGRLKGMLYDMGARWVAIDGICAAGVSESSIPGPRVRPGSSAEDILVVLKQVMSFPRAPALRAGRLPAPMQAGPRSQMQLVLIGASTGGIEALLTVLSAFPEDCPPTAIVQHTGAGFSESLVRLLDRHCLPKVQAAEHGMPLLPGTIVIAAGSSGHLRLSDAGGSLRMTLTSGEPISGHIPSVDALFSSAVPIARSVVAVLMTGMGRDGAAGLLALRQAGARTLGQDEATSVVYGMPRAAFDMGAVQRQLPLAEIGPEILRMCAAGNPAKASMS